MVKRYIMDFACAILAGGRSSRMGRDKVSLRVGEHTLLERVIGVVRDLFPEVVVVARSEGSLNGLGVPVLRDFMPSRGPMVGIATALLTVKAPYALVVACDMPFLSRETIRYMVSQVDGEDLIIPRTTAGYEPLHAIYGKTCLAPMLRLLERDKMKIRDLFPYITTKVLEGYEGFTVGGLPVFTNINTEEDLARVSPWIK